MAIPIHSEHRFLSGLGFILDGVESERFPITPAFWNKAPGFLHKQRIAADIVDLSKVMHQAYIGWELAKSRGWNWGKFFGDWITALLSGEEKYISCKAAFAPWDGLMEFQLDLHSGPHLQSEQRDLRGVKSRLSSLALFGVFSSEQIVYREPWTHSAYLRIPTLSVGVEAQVRQLLDLLPENAFDRRWVVVDLRGNTGGMASSVFAILERIPGWNEVDPLNSFSMMFKESYAVDLLQWGAIQLQLRNVPQPLPIDTRLRYQAVLDRLKNPPSTEMRVRSRLSSRSFRDHRFPSKPLHGRPRVIVLTDSECGSDGEFLVYALSLLPGSVIVGDRTAGVAQFARPGCYLLPRTKIPFRLSSAFIDIYGDRSRFEGLGFAPDLRLPAELVLSPESLYQLVNNLDHTVVAQ